MQKQLRDAILGPIMSSGLSVGLIVIDPDYCILFWNRWLEKQTGIPEVACLNRNLFELFPEIEEQGKRGYLQRCVEQRTPLFLSLFFHKYLIEIQIQHEGTPMPMLQNVRIYPPPPQHESEVGAVIVIEDATEQSLYGQEIALLNRILRAIRSVNQLIARSGPEEDVLQGACDILTNEGGYAGVWIWIDGDEGRGSRSAIQATVPMEESPEMPVFLSEGCHPTCPVRRALETGEIQIADFNQGENWCHPWEKLAAQLGCQTVCALPLIARDETVGALTVHSGAPDVFVGEELKLLEEIAGDIAFAVQARRDAEHRRQAEERQQELEQQTWQQEKLAAVGQFAAGIAHDFNNILTGMMGHAELITLTSVQPASIHDDAKVILEQGECAARLIQQLLDFSRRSIMQKQALELQIYLKELVKLLQRTIPEHVRVSCEVAPGSYVIDADPTQIQQVVMNLAVNAHHVMPDGGELRFRLSSEQLTAEQVPFPQMQTGLWIMLRVTDTGAGMDRETLGHIFEPFFTTKGPGKGSGLGLAQVYGIIKQHEGFIDVESALGVGTTFTLYLPAPEKPQAAAEQPQSIRIPQGKGQTVLVVEDNAQVCQVLEQMLTVLNYRVLTATDGQHALEVHAQHRGEIDLVLTDMVMPFMGGLELHRRLKQENSTVCIVLISGYPLGDNIPESVSGWISKPPSLHKLAQTIAEALD